MTQLCWLEYHVMGSAVGCVGLGCEWRWGGVYRAGQGPDHGRPCVICTVDYINIFSSITV